MQTSVAALLLVVSAVLLTSVVIEYAVNITEATLQTKDIPQVDRIRDFENHILNQTDNLFNQTQTQLPNSPAP